MSEGPDVLPGCAPPFESCLGAPSVSPAAPKPPAVRRAPRSVLIFSQLYRPEPNPIISDVAEGLAHHARVTVITVHPNYPGGRFYPGTRYWLPSKKVENGVTVWRLPFIPDHSNSKPRRLLSFLSYVVMASLIAPFVGGRFDVVWVYQTPFTVALPALPYRLMLRARLVYTYGDLWPESLVAAGVGRPGPLLRLMFGYSRWINRFADAIIGVTRGTAARFRRDGVAPDRLFFVPGWTRAAEARASAAASARTPERRIVYVGNLGVAQQLDTVVRAAAELERQEVDVRFELYGAGADEPRLRALAAELGAGSVVFPGTLSQTEAFLKCRNALAQIVTLRRSPMFRMTIPSKLFFSFHAGAPILAGLEGESAELAEESGGAILYAADDVASLVAAVRELLHQSPEERAAMSARLRDFYDRNFQRPSLIGRSVDTILGRTAAENARCAETSDAPFLSTLQRA